MKRTIFPAIFIALLFLPVYPASGETVSPWIREAVELVNEERASRKLSPLTVSETLSHAASLKLSDMERGKYFAHTSASGQTPWSFFDAAGYDYRYAGENLSIHFKTPEAEHAAWMESEKHCQNILDPRFQEVGMAVRKVFMEGRETILVVQLFGTQRGQETVASSGKDTALAMCRGEVPPSVSGASEEKGDGRIALFAASVSEGVLNLIPDQIRSAEERFRAAEILAILTFSMAQILLVSISLRILLAREYEEGVFPS